MELRPSGNSETSALVHLGAAVAPTQLRPAVPRPPDFDAFWDAKRKALDEVPVNAVLTPTSTTTSGIEFYTVPLASLGSHVQGYLAKPAREGRVPALVLYQYAGVYALRPESAAVRGAEGWLVLNVSSLDLPPIL